MTNPDTFYTLGGTVQPGRGIYVSRKADKELFELCRAGELAYVLNSRQMGKSSLMAHVAEELEAEGIKVVTIDLNNVGQQSSTDHNFKELWHNGIIAEIVDQLDLEFDFFNWLNTQDNLGETYRLVSFFRHLVEHLVSKPIVVFFDEIDSTLNLDFSDDFYGALRALYNERSRSSALNRLSFVLIGVATPSELIHDSNRTPFNIGTQIELSDFTLEEALPFSTGFNLPEAKAKQVLKRALHWTDGHPYLTQVVCKHIASAPDNDWANESIDNLIKNDLFQRRSEKNTHLQNTWSMLSKRPPKELQARVFRIFQKIRRNRNGIEYDPRMVEVPYLKLSGIVKRVGEYLLIRNNIYKWVFDRKWIAKHSALPFWLKYERFIVPGYFFLIFLFISTAFAINQYYKRDALDELLEEQSEEVIALKDTQDSLLAEITISTQRLAALDNSLLATERKLDIAENEVLKANQDAEEADLEAERARSEAAQAERERTQALQEVEQANKNTRTADKRARSVAMAAQAKRYHDIEDNQFAALLAVKSEILSEIPDDSTDERGIYLNEVLDALQLSNNILQGAQSGISEREASIRISKTSSRFEIIDVASHLHDSTVAYSDNNGSLTIWEKDSDIPPKSFKLTEGIGKSLTFDKAGKNLYVLINSETITRYQKSGSQWSEDNKFKRIKLDSIATGNLVVLDERNLIGVALGSHIELYNIQDSMPLSSKLKMNCPAIQALVANQEALIAGCNDGTLVKWENLENGASENISVNISQSKLIDVDALAIDDSLLVIGGKGDNINYGIWTHHFTPSSSPTFDYHKGPIYSLSLSKQWIASGSADGTIRLMPRGNQLSANQREIILKGHKRWVRNVTFIQEGEVLISGSADGSVRRWSLSTKELAKDICQRITSLAKETEWENPFDQNDKNDPCKEILLAASQ